MSLPLLLITGASGFIGSHVLQAALDAGYPVRITSRSGKINILREQLGNKVEIVAVEDVATGDFSEALKGVGAVLHLAAPLPGKEDPEGMLKSAIEGALNILRQSVAAGIPRFIFTSTALAMWDLEDMTAAYKDYTYSEKDWNPAGREKALDPASNILVVYGAAKTIAEQEVWKYVEAHPEIDATSINPVYVYGPFTPWFRMRKGDTGALATNGMFFQCVLSGGKIEHPQFPVVPITVDVRDVAKAHILAITAPPTKEVGQKRMLIASNDNFSWKDASEYLAEVRPQIKDRLADPTGVSKLTLVKNDTSRARDVLGLKEYIGWQKTVVEAADSIFDLLEKAI